MLSSSATLGFQHGTILWCTGKASGLPQNKPLIIAILGVHVLCSSGRNSFPLQNFIHHNFPQLRLHLHFCGSWKLQNNITCIRLCAVPSNLPTKHDVICCHLWYPCPCWSILLCRCHQHIPTDLHQGLTCVFNRFSKQHIQNVHRQACNPATFQLSWRLLQQLFQVVLIHPCWCHRRIHNAGPPVIYVAVLAQACLCVGQRHPGQRTGGPRGFSEHIGRSCLNASCLSLFFSI